MVKQLLRSRARADAGQAQRHAPDDRLDRSRCGEQLQRPRENERKLALQEDRSPFDREYWLAHAHGFLVDTLAGEEVGVVDDVEFDAATGLTSALGVSGGWFGRHRLTVPVADVRQILPGERRLYIDRRPEPGDASGRPPR